MIERRCREPTRAPLDARHSATGNLQVSFPVGTVITKGRNKYDVTDHLFFNAQMVPDKGIVSMNIQCSKRLIRPD